MPLLFAVTMFVSAALLFMVQPMIGRLVLPLVGGSPAAWNTCMVFFQALLLAGYAYAHWLTNRVSPKRQIVIHGSVIALAILMLGVAVALGEKHSPIAIVPSLFPQGSAYPMFGMLALLGVAIGVPFFVVSTSAPLLQKWFAVTGHKSSGDPYFLYAASNAGSLISLLGYPLMIEPNFKLISQQWIWAVGFVALFVLIMLCGRHARNPLPIVADPSHKMSTQADPTWGRILRWVVLAFVPSSLMLGVTFHMTTDIASMPLLWVAPLALYLLTFIIAFSRLPRWFRPLIGNIAPVALLLLVFVMCAHHEVGANESGKAVLWLGLHIGVFFLVTLMCHTEIAYDRPDPKHLTAFFLWMSFGGMLGGIFNGLIAPILFSNSYEYAIALAVAAFVVPVLTDDANDMANEGRRRLWDLAIPVGMFALTAILSYQLMWQYQEFDTLNAFGKWCRTTTASFSTWLTNTATAWNFQGTVKSNTVAAFISYAIPCMLSFFFIDRPMRFGLCVAAILFVGIFRSESGRDVLIKTRSYFGILKASAFNDTNKNSAIFYQKPDNDNPKINFFKTQTEPTLQLVHGTTLHGYQAAGKWTYPMRDDIAPLGLINPWASMLVAGSMEAFDNRQEPLTYYHRTGPVGDMFREAYDRFPEPKVAMIGLGTGSVAAYALPDRPFTFFEIDPAVLKIVDQPLSASRADAARQFTYLADARARGAKVEIILGDGRLKLQEIKNPKYSLLLVDAFSSDSIPLHLLTVEAVKLYMDQLDDNGLLAVHISNKYVLLEPVVSSIVKQLGLAGRVFNDSNQSYSGKSSSEWCVIAKNEAALGNLGVTNADLGEAPPLIGVIGGPAWKMYSNDRWQNLSEAKDVPAWTDDYADVMRMMRMREVAKVRSLFGLKTPGYVETPGE